MVLVTTESEWKGTLTAAELSLCLIQVVMVVQSLSRIQLLPPHILKPARLLCPWNSPGKNTGVGCHFLLQGIFPTQESNLGLLHCRHILYQLSYEGSLKVKFTQSCVTLCDPMYYTVHGTFQAGILEWVAYPFPRGSS